MSGEYRTRVVSIERTECTMPTPRHQGEPIPAWLPIRAYRDTLRVRDRVSRWISRHGWERYEYGEVIGVDGHTARVLWEGGDITSFDIRRTMSVYVQVRP